MVDQTKVEIGRLSRALNLPQEAVIAVVDAMPPRTVKPCSCIGYCAEHRLPEYCADWLAHTYKMEMMKCDQSGNDTWHRDGVCCECYPMFPPSTDFVTV